MMRKTYITPKMETIKIYSKQIMGITFSQVDNDGDGKTDQQLIIEDDPIEIGAKPGFSSDWEE